ncbi:cysteine proteinase [Stylonychia lemnae]|uniref:ubiquitinyl hydrolase 1 n=1 Tax=Stylonychia lemnae TaxID=5949 RepID=A0A077ZW82_STYLE|nr:cysteine proteinase [Stylonychia lemnae]|eukprot:CDW72706.1 cysteine proteinase [Stylonychia lemnae]
MKILTNLKKIWSRYRLGSQEDAHEFLLLFMESFINGCFNGAKPDRTMVYKNQFQTPILKIFGGKSRSQVHCQGCGYKSNTFEDLITLSLDFPRQQNQRSYYGGGGNGGGPINFEQCLNEFCKSENLTGRNQYSCSSCKKKCDAKKRFSIEVSPRILIVHFKRFTNTGQKIQTKVNYPSTFSLNQFMSNNVDRIVDRGMNNPNNQNQQPQNQGAEVYDLFGVVVHIGTSRGGHYYSYCKGSSDKWRELNDDQVSTSNEQEALRQNNAYILFYQKRINTNSIKDMKKHLMDSAMLSHSTSATSSNSSEKDSNHHSEDNKNDVLEMKRYSSIMPNKKVEVKIDDKTNNAKNTEKKKQDQIKQQPKENQKCEVKKAELKQVFKEESKLPEIMQYAPQSHIIKAAQTIAKVEPKVKITQPQERYPQPQEEKLNDSIYLKTLLGQTMKAHNKEQQSKNLNESLNTSFNSKKEEIKKILKDSQTSARKQSTQISENKKELFQKPEGHSQIKVENKVISEISIKPNISPSEFSNKLNLGSSFSDEKMLQSLEQPQLIKSSSKSGSFTVGLRKALHPIVINNATKKRKFSATQFLFPSTVMRNNKRFKFNDDAIAQKQ